MKRFLACLTVLAFALPAQAHFIWLLPHESGQSTARMVFSDELAPDKNVAVTKIAKTKLTACGLDGAPCKTKSSQYDHWYEAIADGKTDTKVLGGTCQYGVLAKGKAEPFLLMYYAKTLVGKNPGFDLKATQTPDFVKGWKALPLEIDFVGGKENTFRVLWQGKPLSKAEVVLLVPGLEEAVTKTTDADGAFDLVPAKSPGLYGIRARHIEKKEGELDGKAYKEIKHYSTLTLRTANVKTSSISTDEPKTAAADPAATKLLADARAARAAWVNFPGFTADLTVNLNGKLHKGAVTVSDKGKVQLIMDDDLKDSVRREIASIVSHRLPGGPSNTPCCFAEDLPEHPQGRTILVLNDELHSSYRIKDRQIMEVNRTQGDARFTISVLENMWNKDKQYLPVAYVVNTWDAKSKALKSSQTHHQTWTRIGAFDLPLLATTITATEGKLSSRSLAFSNHQLAP